MSMKPSITKAKENIQETKKEVLAQTATLINGAFALVAAFAWNEAVKTLINTYVPAGSTLYSQFIYAVAVTIIVVIISMRLTTIIKRYRPEEDKK